MRKCCGEAKLSLNYPLQLVMPSTTRFLNLFPVWTLTKETIFPHRQPKIEIQWKFKKWISVSPKAFYSYIVRIKQFSKNRFAHLKFFSAIIAKFLLFHFFFFHFHKFHFSNFSFFQFFKISIFANSLGFTWGNSRNFLSINEYFHNIWPKFLFVFLFYIEFHFLNHKKCQIRPNRFLKISLFFFDSAFSLFIQRVYYKIK